MTLLFLLMGVGLPLGCSTPDSPARRLNHPDVILITVDTLRPDHLGLYGYERETSPNIDRWFGPAAIYDRAYSTTAATSPSVTSLLTGLLPTRHGVRIHYQLLRDDVPLISDLIGPEYQTAAFVSSMVLTDDAMGLASRFDHFDDFVDQEQPRRKVFERDAGRTTDAALSWLVERRDPERPLLLWLHYIDPHGPYRAPESWPRRFTHDEPTEIDLERMPEYQREPGVTDGRFYIDAYDEEIAYLDEEINRFLESYAAMNWIDRTLLIFTADHGESMMEHEVWFTHSYHVYDEIMRVPLMLRGPGVLAGRYDHPVSGIDVAPTILRHVGIRPPVSMSEIDLRTGEGATDDRIVYLEARLIQHHHAAVQHSRKFVRTVDPLSTEVLGRSFYDLAHDPDELRPRDWPDSIAGDAVERLCVEDPDPAGVPVAARRGHRLSVPKIDPRADPEALTKLRSLGYVQ